MVMTPIDPAGRPALAHPVTVLTVLPDHHAPGFPTDRVLCPDAMEAVRLEPGESVDLAWVRRMRVPYTSRAQRRVQRARATPAAGPPVADHHAGRHAPGWAYEAAVEHRGLLDALGLDLPLTPTAAVPGALLVQHLVPAIALGWYLVTTMHATDQAVLLFEGSYSEHESLESPFPVRWAW